MFSGRKISWDDENILRWLVVMCATVGIYVNVTTLYIKRIFLCVIKENINTVAKKTSVSVFAYHT